MVAEARLLLGIQHLEHRRGRVAAVVGAHLVDLVDQEDGIARRGVAQRPHHGAGHRADVRPPVTADLRLVANAADRNPRELAPEAARDRVAERGLADPGRPDEAQDLPGHVALQLRDGEVLDDPLLHLLEVEVVLVEDLPCVVEVEVVLGHLGPRQAEDPVQVRADDPVLGGGRRQLLEPRRAPGRPLSAPLPGGSSRLPARAARSARPAARRPRRAPPGSPSAAGAGRTRAGPCRSRTRPGTGSSTPARRRRARARGSGTHSATAPRRSSARAGPGAPPSSAAASRRRDGRGRSGRPRWQPRAGAPRGGTESAR